MDSPVYIVTGATGGIGRAIVQALARRGPATIVLAVRNCQAAQALAQSLSHTGCRFMPMHLDLSSLDSVRRMAREFLDTGLPLTALINNAGIMPGAVTVTADGYESATQVNYVATRLLTTLLLPALQPGGAVVFTTSVTRKIARIRPDWAAHALTFRGPARRFITYGRSKRMLAAYAAELARDLAPRQIRVNCADPWIVDSGIISMGNPIIDWLADRLFRPLIYTPSQGAQAALRALDSRQTATIFTRKGQSKNTIECPQYLSDTLQ